MLKESQIYFLFKIAVIFTVLEGYSLKSIPLPWVGSALLIVICFLSIGKLYKTEPPYFKIAIVFFLWAVGITIINISGEYASIMPSEATTPYPIFIFLRFLDLAMFISTFWLVYRLCIMGYREKIVRFIITLGVTVSVIAIYFYLAQIYGFYYPTQNRMTTGGQILSQGEVTYSYFFHRASGTFREPSHLAEWLILPLFLSFEVKRSMFIIFTVVILATVFLTGSLTSILAFGIGMLISMLPSVRFSRAKNMKNIVVVIGILFFSLFLFNYLVYYYSSSRTSLYGVLQQRITPIFETGTEGTDRAYIYNYFFNNPPSFLGIGLGHANILFSKALNIPLMPSFLNLFISVAYSLGIPGIILLSFLLFFPLIKLVKNRNSEIIWVIGAYCAWIVIFVGHSEILPSVFGILYGIILFHLHYKRSANGREKLQHLAYNL